MTMGLSPRVRGNLFKIKSHIFPLGSIPAGAGEPHFVYFNGCPFGVYPRGCGGT